MNAPVLKQVQQTIEANPGDKRYIMPAIYV